MKKLSAVLALLALSTLSSAERNYGLSFVDGNTLLRWLEAETTDVENIVAVGYIQGVADTLTSAGFVCLPKNSTPKQLMDMAKNHLKNKPSKRHYAPGDAIGALYMTTFPCTDSPK